VLLFRALLNWGISLLLCFALLPRPALLISAMSPLAVVFSAFFFVLFCSEQRSIEIDRLPDQVLNFLCEVISRDGIQVILIAPPFFFFR